MRKLPLAMQKRIKKEKTTFDCTLHIFEFDDAFLCLLPRLFSLVEQEFGCFVTLKFVSNSANEYMQIEI